MANSVLKITPVKKHFLKKLYGLTPEAYKALLESQDYVCKICKEPETHKGKTGSRSLCVDHDHKTGRVRGLLCNSCNTMLGVAKDNPTTLLKAIQYLKNKL